MLRAMKKLFSLCAMGGALVLAGCSSDDNTSNGGTSDGGGTMDATSNDAGGDVVTMHDSGGGDTGSSDGGGASDASDSGGGSDGGGDGAITDGGAAMLPFNGCTAATMMSHTDPNDARTLRGPSVMAPSQYTNHCMIIKVGQSVTWEAAFNYHPLEANGGDMPSPIQGTGTGTTVTFTFPNAGLFGWDCIYHPTQMQGVIQVVP
jgi:plastocyanin